MDYLEKMIKNSWDKVPSEYKDRIKDYQIITDSFGFADHKKGTVIFYRKAVERKFQKIIDEMMIKALSQHCAFTEEEAQKLIKKVGVL